MDDSTFSKFWSWAASSYLMLVAIMFGYTTAGGTDREIFDFVSHVNSTTVPAIGVPLDLVIGITMLYLTCSYGDSHRHLAWAARIPNFFFDVDPATSFGKKYRYLTFVLVHVLTLAATGQMLVRYAAASVYQCGGKVVIAGGSGHLDFAALSTAARAGPLCFGAAQAPHTHAWLPWLYVVLAMVFIWRWGVTAWSVFGPARLPPQPSPPPTPLPVLDL